MAEAARPERRPSPRVARPAALWDRCGTRRAWRDLAAIPAISGGSTGPWRRSRAGDVPCRSGRWNGTLGREGRARGKLDPTMATVTRTSSAPLEPVLARAQEQRVLRSVLPEPRLEPVIDAPARTKPLAYRRSRRLLARLGLLPTGPKAGPPPGDEEPGKATRCPHRQLRQGATGPPRREATAT